MKISARGYYIVVLCVIILAGCGARAESQVVVEATSSPARVPGTLNTPTAGSNSIPPTTPPTQSSSLTSTPASTPTAVPAPDRTATHSESHGTPSTSSAVATSTPNAGGIPSDSSTHETPTAVPTTAEPDAQDGPVIVLDPGHDRTTPGALGIEYQINVHAAFIAKDALEAAGYRVYITRHDNDMVFVEDPTLLPDNASEMHPGYSHAYAHASKALEFDPDMVIVLHFNGHPDPNVSGIEVYYCEMGGEQNLFMAEIMRDELVVAMRSIGHEPRHALIREDLSVARGNRHFPSLGNVYDFPTTWIENRYAGIPVVLTEPLYMTNSTEYALIQDDATHVAIAQAYVRAADIYFGRLASGD